MRITLNGQPITVPEKANLMQMLEEWGYSQTTTFAVAINQELLPRPHYVDTVLSEGCEIDIVAPMQGG